MNKTSFSFRFKTIWVTLGLILLSLFLTLLGIVVHLLLMIPMLFSNVVFNMYINYFLRVFGNGAPKLNRKDGQEKS